MIFIVKSFIILHVGTVVGTWELYFELIATNVDYTVWDWQTKQENLPNIIPNKIQISLPWT